MDISELQTIIVCLLKNKNNLEKVISDFGEITNNNGYGTFFLKPKNLQFKFFWIHQQNNEIESVGFGGPHLGFTVKELFSYYKEYKEGYSHYDDEYVYIFFSPDYNNHTIKISSSNKLMEGESIVNNEEINRIEITLREG